LLRPKLKRLPADDVTGGPTPEKTRRLDADDDDLFADDDDPRTPLDQVPML
jgi:hypothetical protein